MIPINIEKVVTVKHVSGSTEFHGEEEYLVGKIKLQGYFDVGQIKELFAAEDFDIDAFKMLFWNKDGERICKSDHKFTFGYQARGLRFEMLVKQFDESLKSVFMSRNATARSPVAEFSIHNQLQLTLTVSCNVTKDQIATMFEYLNHSVTVKLEPLQMDMLEDE